MIIEYTKKRSVNDQAYRDLTPFLNPLPTQTQQQQILHPPIHSKYNNKHKKHKTRQTRQQIRQQLTFNTPILIKTQPKPQKKIQPQPPAQIQSQIQSQPQPPAPAQIQSPMRQQTQMQPQTQTPSIPPNTLYVFLVLIIALNAAVIYFSQQSTTQIHEILKDNQETMKYNHETTTKLIETLQQSMQINSSLQQQTLNLFAEQQKEQQKRIHVLESSKHKRNDNESIELLFMRTLYKCMHSEPWEWNNNNNN